MLTKLLKAISTKADDIAHLLRHCEATEERASAATLPLIQPLRFPTRPDVRGLLLRSMLPAELLNYYVESYHQAVVQMEDFLNTQYVNAASKLYARNFSSDTADEVYVRALQNALITLYNQAVQQAVLGLRSRLDEHKHSTGPTIPIASSVVSPPADCSILESRKSRRGRPHMFTKEQKAVLQALLAYDDQYSTEDKEMIAQALSLTREQVNRWFCNARARGGRKKPYQKPLSRAQRQAIDRLASPNCHQLQNQRSSSVSSSDVSSNTQYLSSIASSDDVEMSSSDCPTDASDQSPFLTATLSPLCPGPNIPFAPLHSQTASPLPSSGHDSYPMTPSNLSTYGLLHSNDSSSSQSTCSSSDLLSHDGLSAFFGTEFTNDNSLQYDLTFTLGDPLSTSSDDPSSFLQPQLTQQQHTHEYWQGFWNQL